MTELRVLHNLQGVREETLILQSLLPQFPRRGVATEIPPKAQNERSETLSCCWGLSLG